jgi:VCBS repeat-containing protein
MKYFYAFLPLCLSSLLLVACGNGDKKPEPKVNTAPYATQMVFSTQAETIYSGKLTGTDADMDSLTFAVATMPTRGTLTLQSDGNFTYLPNADVTGTDQFTFRVSDKSTTSMAAEVNITIDLLQVAFSDYSRTAFLQAEVAVPVPLDSRSLEQDVVDETAYDDLLVNE